MHPRIPLCLLAVLLLAGSSSAADSIDVVIRKITTARNKIETYHLVIINESFRLDLALGGNPNDRQYRKQRFETWHRGNKTRFDSVAIDSWHEAEPAGQRKVRCRNCEREGYILHAAHGPAGTTPIAFYPIDSFPPGQTTDCNWPWLGLSNGVPFPWNHIPQDRFLQTFLNPNVVNEFPIVETMEMLGDIQCRRFTIHVKISNRRISMWVDPRRDDSPIRLETTQDGEIENETTFTYPSRPTNGIWYPDSVRQRLVVKNHHETHNNYTIELAELNQTIPDSVFSYGGLGLLNNIRVLFEDSSDVLSAPVVRDGKLVYPDTKNNSSPMLPSPLQAVPDQFPTPWWSRLPYLVGAVLFAFLGIILVRKFIRRSRG